MSEYGILFSAPMVRALLNTKVGEIAPIDPTKPYKAVTRRLDLTWLKKAKKGNVLWVRETWASPEEDKTRPGRIAYNADGLCGCWIGGGEDRDFIAHGRILEAEGYRECFPAGGASTFGLGKYSDIRRGEYPSYRYGWRTSLFMPKWASRIRLECLEDAREDRLQDISEEDARLEGVEEHKNSGLYRNYGDHAYGASLLQSARLSFQSLWQSLHTKPGERWEDNPRLARIGRFRRIG